MVRNVNEEVEISRTPRNQSETRRDELLTPDEVAVYLRIPKSTLYAWRYHGEGPKAVRVGRHLRYPASELRKWLARGPRGERS